MRRLIANLRQRWADYWEPARCQCPPGQRCDEWMGWH